MKVTPALFYTFLTLRYYRLRGILFSILAGSIISLSWSWRYTPVHRSLDFLKTFLLAFIIIIAAQKVFKFFYRTMLDYLNARPYWRSEFYNFLDTLFLIFSLFFLITFSNNELLSLAMVLILLLFLGWRLNYFFSLHPNAKSWQAANRSIFMLGTFIFITTAFWQLYSFKNYILETRTDDNYIHYAVAARSLTVTLFWLSGFSISGIIYHFTEKKLRYFLIVVWSMLFIFFQLAWVVNFGLLHYSGMFIDPSMINFIISSSDIFKRNSNVVLCAMVAVLTYIFLYSKIMRKIDRMSFAVPNKYWYFYNASIILLSVSTFIFLPYYKNTPEFLIIKSFYNFYKKPNQIAGIDPGILKKLENFGIEYDSQTNFLKYKQSIFPENNSYLPEKFSLEKPNVIIIFLESFSSRLTGVYNKDLAGLTPGLEVMAGDKNTTIFKKYYNASTPTITGLVSQACSFLPPTGQDKIDRQGGMKNNLPCLPEILGKFGGYKYTGYMTAVEKNFAHKDEILAGIGINEIIGKDELSRMIEEKPLSWGYSDHQMFPILIKLAAEKENPFLMMLSTIDTHPPYTLSKDIIKYGDGKSNLLNSVHTTDDAFARFWTLFKKSGLSENTILITVADHAIFPAVYGGDEEKKLLNKTDNRITFYDELVFMMYVPDTRLPKYIETYSSGIDFAPTLLQVLGINAPNYFEGLSILEDRKKFPNILGINEYELYINQESPDKTRNIQFGPPSNIIYRNVAEKDRSMLSLYEYLEYYKWKVNLFESR